MRCISNINHCVLLARFIPIVLKLICDHDVPPIRKMKRRRNKAQDYQHEQEITTFALKRSLGVFLLREYQNFPPFYPHDKVWRKHQRLKIMEISGESENDLSTATLMPLVALRSYPASYLYKCNLFANDLSYLSYVSKMGTFGKSDHFRPTKKGTSSGQIKILRLIL